MIMEPHSLLHNSQAEDDWSETHLVCASAGWGNGGFLLVRPEDEVVAIGGGSLEDMKQADLWCIKEHEELSSKKVAPK
jgi:hypothetical protein